MYFDSHAHIHDPAFDPDRDEVLARAAGAAVSEILLATSDLEDSKAAIKLAYDNPDSRPKLYASVGFHPHEASKWNDESVIALKDLIRQDRERQIAGQRPVVVAIGEIGLDYHYMISPQPKQKEVFSLQLQLAAAEDLPLIIHMREATDDCLAILHEAKSAGFLKRRGTDSPVGVMHCYSETAAELESFLDLGFMIGFDGPITFKNGQNARAALAATPLNRLLLETDSPYLTPAPYRGKRNDSSYMQYIVAEAAQIKGITKEEMAGISRENALRFFRLNEES